MIPGQQLTYRSLAMDVEIEVDSKVCDRLPPKVRLETFFPRIKPGAAPPRFVDDRRDAAIAACEQAFDQACLDVMLPDRDRANSALASQILPGPAEVFAGFHAVPLVGRMR